VAADVLDYKSDAVPSKGDQLRMRVDHYRPQLEAYRRAVSQMTQLDSRRVATRLLFLEAGAVVQL
jgi:ATP-dependent exoDNAse (exonuclease V) beta subunit